MAIQKKVVEAEPSIRSARAAVRKAFKEAITKAEARGYKRGINAGLKILGK